MTVLRDALNEVLKAMLGSDDLATNWWSTPNKAFDMSRPEEVELFKVRDYLMWHAMVGGGS